MAGLPAPEARARQTAWAQQRRLALAAFLVALAAWSCPGSGWAAGARGAAVRRAVEAPVQEHQARSRTSTWKGPRKPLVPALFETFNVTEETDIKAIAGYMSGVLGEDDCRIVDMKMMTAKSRSKALYILAYINAKEVRCTAQVLPRQRDGRCRMRVIYDFPVAEDPEPAVLRVGSNTNTTALANLIAYRLRSVDSLGGESRANTVKLELLGTAASASALLAVEKAHWMTSREMAVVVRFAASDEGDDERPIISATVTAT